MKDVLLFVFMLRAHPCSILHVPQCDRTHMRLVGKTLCVCVFIPAAVTQNKAFKNKQMSSLIQTHLTQVFSIKKRWNLYRSWSSVWINVLCVRELDISSLSSICLPYKDRDQRAHSHINNTCSLGLAERNEEEIRNENFLKSNFFSVFFSRNIKALWMWCWVSDHLESLTH